MQHIIFWAIFLLIGACETEPWSVQTLPGEVVITDERLEPYMDTIQKAVDGYNDKFVKPIFYLKVDFGTKKTCGRIYMHVVDHNDGGEAHADECKQIQSISKDVLDSGDGLRLTIQHELGHGLGLRHSDDIYSIMHYTNEPETWDAKNHVWLQHLTEKDLQNIVDKFGVSLK